MILVYLENSEGKLPKSALVTIEAALAAKKAHGYQKVMGVLLGAVGVAEAANQAAGYGLDEVKYIEDPSLAQYLAIPYAEALKKVVEDTKPQLLVACASSRGKDFIPRVAHALGAAQASDVIEFLEGGTFRRPMFAGNIIADVDLEGDLKVATIRAAAFSQAVTSGANCPIAAIVFQGSTTCSQTFVSFDTVESERPELSEAEIVVSGGRAMKSQENFEMVLAPLADVLGAAIGASRAAVDSGYAPNDWQVGQTGKVVAPKLYIAVGISGAIQHLAGMKDSKVIVAINKDPEAPIFEVADYGLVADLYDVVPQLTAELKKAKS